MYQLTIDIFSKKCEVIKRISDNAWIPMNESNTDYANFKKDLADGAELQDSEGVVMTAEQVNQFIETLA
jgi:hypothetical protein